MTDQHYTTHSGREVKKGTSGAKSALEQLRAAREGGAKRTEQFQVEETKKIFAEVDDDEYERLQDMRKNDDFIVDDDGYGYRDHGGEIWEVDDRDGDGGKKHKKRKLDPNEQHITNFMMPQGAINKKKGGQTASINLAVKQQKPKVSEEQSKDIMNNLFNQLDNKDIDELEDINSSAIIAELNKPIAFNKEEQLYNKYNVTLEQQKQMQIPAGPEMIHHVENPFSKKRKIDEISNTAKNAREQSRVSQSEIDKSHNTSYFDAQSNQMVDDSAADYQSAVDQSRMSDIPRPSDQNQSAQKDEEWAKIKQQQQMNNNMPQVDTLQSYDYPLPLNPDGTLSFYWFDAHEENNGADVYIFGKIYQPEIKQYVSCALKVNGMMREIYALPKLKNKSRVQSAEEEKKQVMSIFHELEDIRKKRFPQINKWMCKPVTRKYAFELPIPHGEHQFLKIKYESTLPSLPQNLTGATFECLFGTNQSMLELFILKRKIKGPCWITIQNPQKTQDFKKTWCRQEISVSDPKHVTVTIDDLNRIDTPPLSGIAFSFKTCRSQHNTNEIAMVSCMVHQAIQQDGPSNNTEKVSTFTMVRKLDGLPIPLGFEQAIKNRKDVLYFTTERQMIDAFINKVTVIDPDMLIAHNLCGGMFELLLSRIQYLKINHWSRIGRMKKSNIPTKKFDTGAQSYGGSQWIPRQVTCGRLLVDTFLTAKELVRETSYDLGYLAKVQLKTQRDEFDEELLTQFYQTKERLLKIVEHTEKDTYLTFSLMQHLSVIPLTKQLTNIAGNLWFRSLQNARAERNEMLLLHEFKKKKFILPDKKNLTAKDLKRNMFEEDFDGEPAAGKGGKAKRKKAQYSGGLVIEPKAGFYDNIILLLDFNSLYPSIIQEYNLCFTTVNRRPTKNFDGSELVQNQFKQIKEGENDQEENEEDEVQLPDKNVNTKDAVLPNVLRDLVQKRRAVKDKMKSEKDAVKLQQLEIRQKAIKLTANSMYGCLGFGSSRFHAKAIAALITKTGRNTLLNTKEIAENKLSFNVVYGDTDSIMINTGTNVLPQALEMGKRLKNEVNVLYKCLEIEIDGVFKSLLLLKKKKYAALKYENFMNPKECTVIREMKGLDMVRRDWCPLSKNVGNYVLDQILSGKSREEVVLNLNEYLSDIGEKMKNGGIPLSEYIITKQLTRALSEYSEIKGQPHVAVAQRMKNQGKSEAELVNNMIPYVVCKLPFKQDGSISNPQLADKAYHPEEVIKPKKDQQVEIDTDYYITQQILPPITRLIEHIDGIEVDFVAQCLGVDAKKYNYHSDKKGRNDGGVADDLGPVHNAILQTETERSLKHRSIAELKVKCLQCGHFYDFPGIYQELVGQQKKDQTNQLSGMHCIKCSALIPTNYLMNRVNLFLKQMLVLYYTGLQNCQEPSCRASTRQLLVNNKCINSTCKGKMTPEYSENQTNDTLRYLQGLFNVKKYLHENKIDMQPGEVPNAAAFSHLQDKVDSVLDRSKFNKVDLGSIFSFMTIGK